MKFADFEALEKTDPLAAKRNEFELKEDTVYLDGNSLGALPKSVNKRSC